MLKITGVVTSVLLQLHNAQSLGFGLFTLNARESAFLYVILLFFDGLFSGIRHVYYDISAEDVMPFDCEIAT